MVWEDSLLFPMWDIWSSIGPSNHLHGGGENVWSSLGLRYRVHVCERVCEGDAFVLLWIYEIISLGATVCACVIVCLGRLYGLLQLTGTCGSENSGV